MLKLIIALAKTNKIAQNHPIEKIIFAIVPIVLMGYAKTPIPILFNIIVFLFAHYQCKNSRRIVIQFTTGIALFAALSSITFVLDYGIEYCSILLLKSISAGLCLSFFSLTTPIDDVLYLLSKNSLLREVCDIAKSMERFIILIDEERVLLYNAILSRGGFDGFKMKIQHTGKMAGLLFVNTMKRWTEIKNGIDSRCYRGYMPYLKKEFNFSVRRMVVVSIYNAILMLLIIYQFRYI